MGSSVPYAEDSTGLEPTCPAVRGTERAGLEVESTTGASGPEDNRGDGAADALDDVFFEGYLHFFDREFADRHGFFHHPAHCGLRVRSRPRMLVLHDDAVLPAGKTQPQGRDDPLARCLAGDAGVYGWHQ